jgi:hypothetical protein
MKSLEIVDTRKYSSARFKVQSSPTSSWREKFTDLIRPTPKIFSTVCWDFSDLRFPLPAHRKLLLTSHCGTGAALRCRSHEREERTGVKGGVLSERARGTHSYLVRWEGGGQLVTSLPQRRGQEAPGAREALSTDLAAAGTYQDLQRTSVQ